jgi:flagellar basal body-associated protein FliL
MNKTQFGLPTKNKVSKKKAVPLVILVALPLVIFVRIVLYCFWHSSIMRPRETLILKKIRWF